MMKSHIFTAGFIRVASQFGRKRGGKFKRLTMLAVALGGLCNAGVSQTAHARTMILSRSFVISDVPEISTCCNLPTGNQFPSVSGNFSITYDDSVPALNFFSPAPVISLDSFQIGFENPVTGPKEFGLFDGVVALINQGPGFANFLIQSNPPPSPDQEGFFLEIEISSDNGTMALFEYTPGNSSTYYFGSAAVPEASTSALLALGFACLGFVQFGWTKRRGGAAALLQCAEKAPTIRFLA
jgi:hypothetical protein